MPRAIILPIVRMPCAITLSNSENVSRYHVSNPENAGRVSGGIGRPPPLAIRILWIVISMPGVVSRPLPMAAVLPPLGIPGFSQRESGRWAGVYRPGKVDRLAPLLAKLRPDVETQAIS